MLAEEMARIGARNPIQGMGPGMFGHTLLEYGNEEQKLQHFPPICRGELRWCQGFSEPGAGSDLASLTTKAEDKGDHYLVNGQKIWTSGAQFADWCFCLVRTDTSQEARGHQLPADRHASARRRGAADQDDLRRVGPVRDLLHRREGAEGEPGRSAERRLGDRQAPAAARAQRHGQPRWAAAAAAASRPASRTWPRSYIGVDASRPAGRRRPARADHRPQDGGAGPAPDRAPRRRRSPRQRQPQRDHLDHEERQHESRLRTVPS